MVGLPGVQLLGLAAEEERRRQLALLQQQQQAQQLIPALAMAQALSGQGTKDFAPRTDYPTPPPMARPPVARPPVAPPVAPPAPPAAEGPGWRHFADKAVIDMARGVTQGLPGAQIIAGGVSPEAFTAPWGARQGGTEAAGFGRAVGELGGRIGAGFSGLVQPAVTDVKRFFTESEPQAQARMAEDQRTARAEAAAAKTRLAINQGKLDQPGAQQLMQPPAPTGKSAYDVILGNGAYGGTVESQFNKPLSALTMGNAYGFGRSVMAPATIKAGIGRDSRGLVGSTAMGAYQITGENMQRYGKRFWGDNWRAQPFDAATQDKIGSTMFAENNGSPQQLKNTWAGLKKYSDSRVAAIAAMPWDQAKFEIQKAEGTYGGGAGGSGGARGIGDMFDTEGYGDRAMAMWEQIKKDASAPFTMTTDEAPRPATPMLESAPHRDYTASDAALQEMRPEEFSYADQKKTLRRNMFAGLGQALANMPDGAGLGKVLAAFGGGVLSGRAAGEDEVQRRQDAFDARMAQFKSAVFRNEQDKGNSLHQDLINDTNTRNQNSLNQYNANMEEWKRNLPQFSERGSLITTLKNGKRTATWTPNPSFAAIQAGGAMANIMMAQDEFKFGVNKLELQAALQHSMELALKSGDPEAVAATPSLYAGAAVARGGAEKIVGDPEAYADLEEQSTKAANSTGFAPMTDKWAEAKQGYMAMEIARRAGGDPEFMKRLMAIGNEAVQISRQSGDEKIRVQQAAQDRRDQLRLKLRTGSSMFGD